MNDRLQAYRQCRDDLLAQIVTELSGDERFVAAWLTGSYGRNDQDDVSDLDLSLVVAEAYMTSLCARHEEVSHQTTEERLILFRKFGEPALIHENNHNAPEGGTFTFVLYSSSAIMIDWTLMPESNAERPAQSVLLFEKSPIPIAPSPMPEDLEKSKKVAAEQWAFFWMMTAIVLKYMIRHDDVFVTTWLENLHEMRFDIERRIRREPPAYQRGSLSQLQPNRGKQIEAIRGLCRRMQELQPDLAEFIGFPPAAPLEEIEYLLSLAGE